MIRDKMSCHGTGRRSTSVDDCSGRFDDARDIGDVLPSAPLERGDGVIGERHALPSHSSHSKSSSHLDCSVVGVKTTTSFGADRSMSGGGVSGLRQHRGEVLEDDVRHGYPWMKAASSTRRMTISGRTRRGSIVHGSCNTPGVEQAEA
jgi:hypothetical protein